MDYENKYLWASLSKNGLQFQIKPNFWIVIGYWSSEPVRYGVKVLWFENGVLNIIQIKLGVFQLTISVEI